MRNLVGVRGTVITFGPGKLVAWVSVARVQLRTSKGITVLLLPPTSFG